MNKCLYRIIFNKARGLWMVVAENVIARGRPATAKLTGRKTFSQTSNALFFNPLLISIKLIMGTALCVALPAHADIVADNTAPVNQQAQITATANGIEQVNIQTPSAGGVSRNTYSQFDVNASGTILNNAVNNVQTQQGGWVIANPLLNAGSASVILNEVNATNPSQLQGFMEIAGQKAQVIVANPAGISCSGCGFINATRGTLTTGTPTFTNGALTGYNVTGGQITVQGAGLNALGADYTDLIARSVQVNAAIHANELNITTGTNQVSVDHSEITPTTDSSGDTPSVAIDVASLGGMYANKIMLVGTEDGVGVNNQGDLGLAAGEFTLSLNGTLVNKGVIQSGTTTLTANAIDNQSGANLYGDTLTVDSTQVDNSGDITGQTTDIQSEQLNNTGLVDGQTTHIESTTINNTGTGRIYGDTLSLQATTLNNEYDAETSTAPTLAARNRLDIGATTITNKGAGDSSNVHAYIYSAGDMAIGGSLDGNNQATGQANVLNNNSATINARSNLNLDAAIINNTNDHIETTVVATTSGDIDQYRISSQSARYDSNQVSISFNEVNHLNTPTGTSTSYHRYRFRRTISQTEITSSNPAKILAGGNLTIKANILNNAMSDITAGLNLNISDVNTLNNTGLSTTKTTSDNGTDTSYWRIQEKSTDRQGASNASYRPAATVETITVGIVDLKSNTATSAQVNIPANNSLLIERPDPSADYLIETDPRFASFRDWLSSDYLLNRLKLNAALQETLFAEMKSDPELRQVVLDKILLDVQLQKILFDTMLEDTSLQQLVFTAMQDDSALKDLVFKELLNEPALQKIVFEAMQNNAELKDSVFKELLDEPALQKIVFEAMLGDPALKNTVFKELLNDSALQQLVFATMLDDPALKDTVFKELLDDPALQKIVFDTMLSDPALKDTVFKELLDDPILQKIVFDTMLGDPALKDTVFKELLDDPILQKIVFDTMLGDPALKDIVFKELLNDTSLQQLVFTTMLKDVALKDTVFKELLDDPSLQKIVFDTMLDDPALKDTVFKELLDDPTLQKIVFATMQNDVALKDIVFNELLNNESLQKIMFTTLLSDAALKDSVFNELLDDPALQKIVFETMRDDTALKGIVFTEFLEDASLQHLMFAKMLKDTALKDTVFKEVIKDSSLQQLMFSAMLDDPALKDTVFNELLKDASLQKIVFTTMLNDAALKDTVFQELLKDASLQQLMFTTMLNDPALKDTVFKELLDDPSLQQLMFTTMLNDPALKDTVFKELLNDSTLQKIVFDTMLGDPALKDTVFKELLNDPSLQQIVFNTMLNDPALKATVFKELLNDPSLQQIVFDTMLGDAALKDTVFKELLNEPALQQIVFNTMLGDAALKNTVLEQLLNDAGLQQIIFERMKSESELQQILFAELLRDPSLQQILFDKVLLDSTLLQIVFDKMKSDPLLQQTLFKELLNDNSVQQVLLDELQRDPLLQQALLSKLQLDPALQNVLFTKMQLESTSQQKRLGDGFYEQELVREQIQNITGKQFLGGYVDAEVQYRDLMDAGVVFAQTHGLVPGVKISAEQMVLLTSDMVWLEEQEVTLADGTKQAVLAPKVYLVVRDEDVSVAGGLLSGENVLLDNIQDLNNSGAIVAEETVVISATNINNEGGQIAAKEAALVAIEDIVNLGGTIAAADSLTLEAGQDIHVATTTQSTSNETEQSHFSQTNVDQVASLSVSNTEGKLSLTAERDIKLEGAVVLNNGDNSTTTFIAGQDIEISTVDTGNSEHIVRDSNNWVKQSSTQEVGSVVQGESIDLSAGNDLTVHGSSIHAEQNLTADADNNIIITAGHDTETLEEHHKQKSKGFFSSKTYTQDYEADSDTLQTSQLSAANINLTAQQDLTIDSGQLAAAQDINLAADELTITATQEEDYYSEQQSKKGTFSSARLSQESLLTHNVASQLDAGNNITLNSQIAEDGAITVNNDSGAVSIEASKLNAQNNLVIASSDDDITITTKNEINYQRQEQNESQFFGIVKKSEGQINREQLLAASQLKTSEEDLSLLSGKNITITGSDIEAAGDLNLQAEEDIRVTAGTESNQSQEWKEHSFSEYFSTSGLFNESTSERTTLENKTLKTSALSGENVTLTAQDDILISSSNINADVDISLHAKNALTITAAQEETYQFTKDIHKNAFNRINETNESLKTNNVGSELNAGNDITLNSALNDDGTVTVKDSGAVFIEASQLTAENNLVIASSDNDVSVVAKEEIDYQRTEKNTSKFFGFSKTTEGNINREALLTASELETKAQDLSLLSGKNITLVASDINAAGDLNLQAQEDILVSAGIETQQTREWKEKERFLSKGTLYSKEEGFTETSTTTARASNLESGNDINISGSRATIVGSDLSANNSINAQTDVGDIEVLAAQQEHTVKTHQEEMHISFGDAAAGIFRPDEAIDVSDGKLNVKLAEATIDEVDTYSEDITHRSSHLVANNNTVLDAAGDVLIEGSQIIADADNDQQGDINITARDGDVTIKEAKNSFFEETEELHGRAAISAVVEHKAVEVVKAVINVKDAKDQLKQANEDYRQYEKNLDQVEKQLQTLETDYANKVPGVNVDDLFELRELREDMNDDEAWYQAGLATASVNLASAITASIQQAAAAAASVATWGFDAGIQLDIEGQKRRTESQHTESVKSLLVAENINVQTGTTGNQAETKTLIQGTDLSANGDLNITTGELEIAAARDTSTDHTEGENVSTTISQTLWGAASGGGPSINASYNRDRSKDRSTTYINSTMVADNINLTSLGDTEIKGANIEADAQLALNVGGNLTVESRQNRSSGSNNSFGVSAGFSLSGDGDDTDSGEDSSSNESSSLSSINGGFNSGNGRYYNKQTVLTSLIGEKVDINVGKHTQVNGALIAAQDDEGQDNGQLALNTDTFNFAHRTNTTLNSQRNIGFSSSVGIKDRENPSDPTQQGATDAKGEKELHLNTSHVQYSNTSHYDKSKTLATIGQGSLTVHQDTANGTDSTEGLNRDIAKTDKDLFSVDRQQGNIDMTVDHRLLSKNGLQKIAKDIKTIGSAIGKLADVIKPKTTPQDEEEYFSYASPLKEEPVVLSITDDETPQLESEHQKNNNNIFDDIYFVDNEDVSTDSTYDYVTVTEGTSYRTNETDDIDWDSADIADDFLDLLPHNNTEQSYLPDTFEDDFSINNLSVTGSRFNDYFMPSSSIFSTNLDTTSMAILQKSAPDDVFFYPTTNNEENWSVPRGLAAGTVQTAGDLANGTQNAFAAIGNVGIHYGNMLLGDYYLPYIPYKDWSAGLAIYNHDDPKTQVLGGMVGPGTVLKVVKLAPKINSGSTVYRWEGGRSPLDVTKAGGFKPQYGAQSISVSTDATAAATGNLSQGASGYLYAIEKPSLSLRSLLNRAYLDPGELRYSHIPSKYIQDAAYVADKFSPTAIEEAIKLLSKTELSVTNATTILPGLFINPIVPLSLNQDKVLSGEGKPLETTSSPNADNLHSSNNNYVAVTEGTSYRINETNDIDWDSADIADDFLGLFPHNNTEQSYLPDTFEDDFNSINNLSVTGSRFNDYFMPSSSVFDDIPTNDSREVVVNSHIEGRNTPETGTGTLSLFGYPVLSISVPRASTEMDGVFNQSEEDALRQESTTANESNDDDIDIVFDGGMFGIPTLVQQDDSVSNTTEMNSIFNRPTVIKIQESVNIQLSLLVAEERAKYITEHGQPPLTGGLYQGTLFETPTDVMNRVVAKNVRAKLQQIFTDREQKIIGGMYQARLKQPHSVLTKNGVAYHDISLEEISEFAKILAKGQLGFSPDTLDDNRPLLAGALPSPTPNSNPQPKLRYVPGPNGPEVLKPNGPGPNLRLVQPPTGPNLRYVPAPTTTPKAPIKGPGLAPFIFSLATSFIPNSAKEFIGLIQSPDAYPTSYYPSDYGAFISNDIDGQINFLNTLQALNDKAFAESLGPSAVVESIPNPNTYYQDAVGNIYNNNGWPTNLTQEQILAEGTPNTYLIPTPPEFTPLDAPEFGQPQQLVNNNNDELANADTNLYPEFAPFDAPEFGQPLNPPEDNNTEQQHTFVSPNEDPLALPQPFVIPGHEPSFAPGEILGSSETPAGNQNDNGPIESNPTPEGAESDKPDIDIDDIRAAVKRLAEKGVHVQDFIYLEGSGIYKGITEKVQAIREGQPLGGSTPKGYRDSNGDTVLEEGNHGAVAMEIEAANGFSAEDVEITHSRPIANPTSLEQVEIFAGDGSIMGRVSNPQSTTEISNWLAEQTGPQSTKLTGAGAQQLDNNAIDRLLAETKQPLTLINWDINLESLEQDAGKVVQPFTEILQDQIRTFEADIAHRADGLDNASRRSGSAAAKDITGIADNDLFTIVFSDSAGAKQLVERMQGKMERMDTNISVTSNIVEKTPRTETLEEWINQARTPATNTSNAQNEAAYPFFETSKIPINTTTLRPLDQTAVDDVFSTADQNNQPTAVMTLDINGFEGLNGAQQNYVLDNLSRAIELESRTGVGDFVQPVGTRSTDHQGITTQHDISGVLDNTLTVIMPGSDVTAANKLAERIQGTFNSLTGPLKIDHESIFVAPGVTVRETNSALSLTELSSEAQSTKANPRTTEFAPTNDLRLQRLNALTQQAIDAQIGTSKRLADLVETKLSLDSGPQWLTPLEQTTLNDVFATADQNNQPTAVITLDIDGFQDLTTFDQNTALKQLSKAIELESRTDRLGMDFLEPVGQRSADGQGITTQHDISGVLDNAVTVIMPGSDVEAANTLSKRIESTFKSLIHSTNLDPNTVVATPGVTVREANDPRSPTELRNEAQRDIANTRANPQRTIDFSPPNDARLERLDQLQAEQNATSDSILAMKSHLAKLKAAATTDPLTGLGNRALEDRAVNTLFQRADRQDQPVTLINWDIANFKALNDHLGHQAGDKALQIIADSIQAVIRSGEDGRTPDVSGIGTRPGGDEFNIILPNVDLTIGQSVAERIQTRIDIGLKNEGLNLPALDRPVFAVPGLVERAPNDSRSIEDLRHEADLNVIAKKKEIKKQLNVPLGREEVTGNPIQQQIPPQALDNQNTLQPNTNNLQNSSDDSIRVMKQYLAQLKAAATTDPLTGLGNRALEDRAVDTLFERADRQDQPVTLISWDIANFKALNDALGHQAGDRALQIIADAIQAEIRAVDIDLSLESRARDVVGIATRPGGDEFNIILPSTTQAQGERVAQRIQTRINIDLTAEGLNLPAEDRPVFAVPGLVERAPNDSRSIEDLRHEADLNVITEKTRIKLKLGIPLGREEAQLNHSTNTSTPPSISPSTNQGNQDTASDNSEDDPDDDPNGGGSAPIRPNTPPNIGGSGASQADQISSQSHDTSSPNSTSTFRDPGLGEFVDQLLQSGFNVTNTEIEIFGEHTGRALGEIDVVTPILFEYKDKKVPARSENIASDQGIEPFDQFTREYVKAKLQINNNIRPNVNRPVAVFAPYFPDDLVTKLRDTGIPAFNNFEELSKAYSPSIEEQISLQDIRDAVHRLEDKGVYLGKKFLYREANGSYPGVLEHLELLRNGQPVKNPEGYKNPAGQVLLVKKLPSAIALEIHGGLDLNSIDALPGDHSKLFETSVTKNRVRVLNSDGILLETILPSNLDSSQSTSGDPKPEQQKPSSSSDQNIQGSQKTTGDSNEDQYSLRDVVNALANLGVDKEDRRKFFNGEPVTFSKPVERGEVPTVGVTQLLDGGTRLLSGPVVIDLESVTNRSVTAYSSQIMEIRSQSEILADALGLNSFDFLSGLVVNPKIEKKLANDNDQKQIDFLLPSLFADEPAEIGKGYITTVTTKTGEHNASKQPTTQGLEVIKLGDLQQDEILAIQNATDQLGENIYVVGSAAKGTRRGIGTDLPLAEYGEPKTGTRSDIDYIVAEGIVANADQLGLPDVDPTFGVAPVDYIDLDPDKGPVIQFQPGHPPQAIASTKGGKFFFNEEPVAFDFISGVTNTDKIEGERIDGSIDLSTQQQSEPVTTQSIREAALRLEHKGIDFGQGFLFLEGNGTELGIIEKHQAIENGAPVEGLFGYKTTDGRITPADGNHTAVAAEIHGKLSVNDVKILSGPRTELEKRVTNVFPESIDQSGEPLNEVKILDRNAKLLETVLLPTPITDPSRLLTVAKPIPRIGGPLDMNNPYFQSAKGLYGEENVRYEPEFPLDSIKQIHNVPRPSIGYQGVFDTANLIKNTGFKVDVKRPFTVFEYKGHYFQDEGHHRKMAMDLLGESTVPTVVIRITKYNPTYEDVLQGKLKHRE